MDGLLGNLASIVKRGAFGGLLQNDEDLLKQYIPEQFRQGLTPEQAAEAAQKARGIASAALFSPRVDANERTQLVQNALLGDIEGRQKAQQQSQMQQILSMFAPASPQQALSGGGGPTQANAAQIGAQPTAEQAQRALMLAVQTGNPAIIEQARKLKDLIAPQFKTQSVQELMVGDKAKKFAVGDDGTMRELGVSPDKLIQVDAGGQKYLVSETTGKQIQKFDVTMDAAQRAQIGLGYSRLAFDKEQANKPSYDFMNVDGRVVVGDKRTGQIAGQTGASQKDVQQISGATNAVLEAASIIPQSTGSLAGRGLDLAAGAFGVGTKGAEAIAKLEVIGAKLTANVPRFEGPQSNIDVQGYKQAAADVANPLKPASVRLEALKTAAGLIKKDAEMKGIPLPPEFEQFTGGNVRPRPSVSPQGGAPIDSLLDKYAPRK